MAGDSSNWLQPFTPFRVQAREMRRRRVTCKPDLRMPLIFFNNQSGDDVVQAMRAARRREAKVVLSHTLVRELRAARAGAGPRDDTVVLLRPEHRKRPHASRWTRWLRALGVLM